MAKLRSPYEPEPKKKNPQDTTLRNLRAIKKRIRLLETRVTAIEAAFFGR